MLFVAYCRTKHMRCSYTGETNLVHLIPGIIGALELIIVPHAFVSFITEVLLLTILNNAYQVLYWAYYLQTGVCILGLAYIRVYFMVVNFRMYLDRLCFLWVLWVYIV